MAFGIIMFTLLLYAPNGQCDENNVVAPEAAVEKCVRDCEPTVNVESEEDATLLMLVINYFKSGGM